jgi:hypothetical protein
MCRGSQKFDWIFKTRRAMHFLICKQFIEYTTNRKIFYYILVSSFAPFASFASFASSSFASSSSSSFASSSSSSFASSSSSSFASSSSSSSSSSSCSESDMKISKREDQMFYFYLYLFFRV